MAVFMQLKNLFKLEEIVVIMHYSLKVREMQEEQTNRNAILEAFRL